MWQARTTTLRWRIILECLTGGPGASLLVPSHTANALPAAGYRVTRYRLPSPLSFPLRLPPPSPSLHPFPLLPHSSQSTKISSQNPIVQHMVLIHISGFILCYGSLVFMIEKIIVDFRFTYHKKMNISFKLFHKYFYIYMYIEKKLGKLICWLTWKRKSGKMPKFWSLNKFSVFSLIL